MVDWLKTGISGCQFARAFARDRGPAEIRISAVGALDEGPVADTLQALLTQAAAARTAVIFVFPRMRVDEEIADLLSTLALNPSFKLAPLGRHRIGDTTEGTARIFAIGGMARMTALSFALAGAYI